MIAEAYTQIPPAQAIVWALIIIAIGAFFYYIKEEQE